MNDSITNKQIASMIFAVIVGYGIINLPNDAATAAGTGSWIPLAFNTIVTVLLAYIISSLEYHHENKTLFEYSQKLIGKIPGKAIVIIYIIYFFIFLVYLVKSYSDIITLIFFLKTPVRIISLFLLFIAGYALTKNLSTIARLTEIYVFLVIIGFIFIQIIVLTQGNMLNIRPILGTENIISYLKASYELILPFIGLEIILFIPINKIDNKGIFKYTTLAIAFIGLLYIFVVESTISVVGVEDIVFYNSSVFKVLEGIDLPFLEVIRRPDGFYVMFWTMNLFCDICIIFYLILKQSEKLFTKLSPKIIIISIIAAYYVMSLFIKTPREMDIIRAILKNFGLITSIIIPVILLIITKVKSNEN